MARASAHPLRAAALAALLACAAPGFAKTLWVVGSGAPGPLAETAETLGVLLGEPVQTLPVDNLAAWTCSPRFEEEREAALQADRLLISPSPDEPEGRAFLALCSLRVRRGRHLPPPLVVASQTPVYKMHGLCDAGRLQRTARLAAGSGCVLAPLPKIWQQVYTDDAFYDGRIQKGPRTEAYVFASGLLLALQGDETPLAPLPGVHEDVAKALDRSIRKGFAKRDDVLFAAERRAAPPYPLRTGNAFAALLYDGAFEHALGEWLQRFAEADGRTLTLHYTADTEIETGLPGLFRTVRPAPHAANARLYTRPAFRDDSGDEELRHLPEILAADGGNPAWMPFPLALAEWRRQFPGQQVYDGALPSSPVAAMFAAMLYLDWTGAAVLPGDIRQSESVAIGIGLETMLRMRTLRADVNAVLLRSLGGHRYAFSLWRRPGEKVELDLGSDAETSPSKRKLFFRPGDFWAPQVVTAEGPGTLLWKIPSGEDFRGQNTGARALQPLLPPSQDERPQP